MNFLKTANCILTIDVISGPYALPLPLPASQDGERPAQRRTPIGFSFDQCAIPSQPLYFNIQVVSFPACIIHV